VRQCGWSSLTLSTTTLHVHSKLHARGRGGVGEHVVKVVGGGAEFKRGRDGKLLLRIKIAAEVDGVRREYTITYSKLGRDKAAVGRAYARADARGAGRQTPRGSRRL